MSSDIRYIPASSEVSVPTSRLGSVDLGRLSKIWESSPGASFDAQPAHLTVAVSRTFFLVIIYLSNNVISIFSLILIQS